MERPVNKGVEFGYGAGTAIVADNAWLLLDVCIESQLPGRAWEAFRSGNATSWLIDVASQGALLNLPSFAMVLRESAGLRIFARGVVKVIVGDNVVQGSDATTWVEQLLGHSETVCLGIGGDPISGDSPYLTTGGIVPAGLLRVSVQPGLVPDAPVQPRIAGILESTDGPEPEGPIPTSGGEQRVRLRAWDGRLIELDRPVVVGRAPVVPDGDDPQTLVITVSAGDISRSHVHMSSTSTGISVTDLGSANGTVISGVGDEPEYLEPNQPTVLGADVRISLSDDIWFDVEID